MLVDFCPPVQLADRVVQHDSAARGAERPAGLVEEAEVRLDAHRVLDGIDAWLDLNPSPGQRDRSSSHFGAVHDFATPFGTDPGHTGAPEAACGFLELMLLLVEARADSGDPSAD